MLARPELRKHRVLQLQTGYWELDVERLKGAYSIGLPACLAGEDKEEHREERRDTGGSDCLEATAQIASACCHIASPGCRRPVS